MRIIRHGLAAALVMALGFPTSIFAQDAPAAPAVLAPVPAIPAPEPPASQLAAARDLVISSGMSRSFAPMIPQLTDQIGPMLTRTRPEMAKDLSEVVKQLAPEFDKKADEMIDVAAHVYARRMSEEDLKKSAEFFNSPAGKKYVDSQPALLDELVVAMQSWTQQISTFMMTRVRQEMMKKGHQF